MPELQDQGVREKRRVEVLEDDRKDGTRLWKRGTIEAVGLDGYAKVRWDHDPGRAATFPLDTTMYRWLSGERVRDWDAE